MDWGTPAGSAVGKVHLTLSVFAHYAMKALSDLIVETVDAKEGTYRA